MLQKAWRDQPGNSLAAWNEHPQAEQDRRQEGAAGDQQMPPPPTEEAEEEERPEW